MKGVTSLFVKSIQKVMIRRDIAKIVLRLNLHTERLFSCHRKDCMQDLVLAYFEAIDANNWTKVDDILALAQQDQTLETALCFLHQQIECLSDTPYVRQIMEWRQREKGI